MTARHGVGLTALALLVLIAVLPHRDPFAVDQARAYQPPGRDHLLGTDHLGRDLFARVAVGLDRTLLVVALACVIGTGLGLLIGLVAGWVGPRGGDALLGLADAVLIVPTFIAALMISAIFGFGPVTAGLALGIFGAGPCAHQTRALTRAALTRESVEIEALMGTPGTTVLLRHVLPVVIRPVAAYLGSSGAGVAVAYAGLAFIGLGVDTTVPDWGAMIYEYRVSLMSHPLLLLWPTAGVVLVAVALNSLVDSGAGGRG